MSKTRRRSTKKSKSKYNKCKTYKYNRRICRMRGG